MMVYKSDEKPSLIMKYYSQLAFPVLFTISIVCVIALPVDAADGIIAAQRTVIKTNKKVRGKRAACLKKKGRLIPGVMIRKRFRKLIRVAKFRKIKENSPKKYKKIRKRIKRSCKNNSSGSWTPPIGIPAPSFGITQSHTMYQGQTFDFGSGPEPYKDAGNGPYTHYVDSTHPQATNTDNQFGTAETPRLSIPRALPAGSVVEIHNSSNANGWGAAQLGGEGTEDKPIFIRGIGSPRLDFGMVVGYYDNASYIIVEGISFFRGGILGRQNGTTFTTSYISVRNCEFYGDESSGGFGITSYTDNPIEQLVLYNNSIHDNGIWDPEVAVGDQDIHGIGVGSKVTYLWVVDNEMYHNSGDGIQINSGGTNLSRYIYVGRNISHHNKQSGFWTKTALDVIFSQNTSYGHKPSSSAPGPGMGFQYDPKRVWFLFNHSYDNNYGIHCGSGNVGGREEFYFIGNVIHDVPNGISLNGLNTPEPAKIIGNTIYNADNGIYNGYYNAKMDIINNIIAASDNQIYFTPGYRTPELSLISYNLFQGPISIVWSGTHTDLASFQSSTSLCQGCIEGDPNFVNAGENNFHIKSSSPAKNVALSSGLVKEVFDRFRELYGIDIEVDFAGQARQGKWDMGAFEYLRNNS